MAVPGTAARPPRGGLAAARPAQPDDAENAAAPSNAGGELAIFTDPEFGKPWRWWCVTTVMVLLDLGSFSWLKERRPMLRVAATGQTS
jgi:hypothetical protein